MERYRVGEREEAQKNGNGISQSKIGCVIPTDFEKNKNVNVKSEALKH